MVRYGIRMEPDIHRECHATSGDLWRHPKAAEKGYELLLGTPTLGTPTRGGAFGATRDAMIW